MAKVTVKTLCHLIGSMTITNVNYAPPYAEHIIREVFDTGAIALVVSLLRIHCEDIFLFERYLDFVKQVAPYRLTALVQCCAHEIIFIRMKHMLPSNVLKSSMYALVCMVSNRLHTIANSSGVADSLDFCDMHGGMDTVLGYLQQRIDNDNINISALHLVRAIIFNYPELVSRMCAAGLIPMIFAVLERKPPGLWQNVVIDDLVSIICQMTENSTHIHLVPKEITMNFLVMVMKDFQLFGLTMPFAITAICNLTNLNDTSRRAAAPENLIRDVINTMGIYEDTIVLQRAGMRALLCFLGSWRNVDEVISSGGVVRLLMAMMNFRNDLCIAKHSLLAISIIVRHNNQSEFNRKYMLSTEEESHDGIIICTLNLMRVHASELLVQKPAVSLLATLVMGYPNLYADLRNAGGILVLSRVLEWPLLETGIRKMVLKLLKLCSPAL